MGIPSLSFNPNNARIRQGGMRHGSGTSLIFPPGEEITKLVRSDSRRAELKLRAVRKAVVAHPTDGYEYLAELSRRPEDKTRVWASTWGTVVFRGRFAPVLLEILRQSKAMFGAQSLAIC